jgi:ABC-type dipeptide/oligopeptide/nickel transport system permease component
MSYLKYTLKRLLVSVLMLVGASILIFSIVRLIPGDPARIIAGEGGTQQSVEAIRHQLGLHLPIWEQYLNWATDIITGQWGQSFTNGQSVRKLVLQRFPRSLQLAVFGMTISIFISFPLGIYAAINRNSTSDYTALIFSQVGVSIPRFWLGILSILVFARYLNVLPPSGYAALTKDPIGHLKHAILPAATLGVANAAVITRYLRSELLEELGKDYIRTAHALGHPKKRVLGKYVLKNALIPTVTMLGLQFGFMIGGIVIVEKVFAYPGIGLLVLDSLLVRDYPLIQLSLLLLAGTFLTVNLIIDLVYGLLDPKIRY